MHSPRCPPNWPHMSGKLTPEACHLASLQMLLGNVQVSTCRLQLPLQVTVSSLEAGEQAGLSQQNPPASRCPAPPPQQPRAHQAGLTLTGTITPSVLTEPSQTRHKGAEASLPQTRRLLYEMRGWVAEGLHPHAVLPGKALAKTVLSLLPNSPAQALPLTPEASRVSGTCERRAQSRWHHLR